MFFSYGKIRPLHKTVGKNWADSPRLSSLFQLWDGDKLNYSGLAQATWVVGCVCRRRECVWCDVQARLSGVTAGSLFPRQTSLQKGSILSCLWQNHRVTDKPIWKGAQLSWTQTNGHRRQKMSFPQSSKEHIEAIDNILKENGDDSFLTSHFLLQEGRSHENCFYRGADAGAGAWSSSWRHLPVNILVPFSLWPELR